MASFTRLDDADVRRLVEAFGLGSVDRWQTIEAGTINSNFALSTGSGRYFLRINEGKSEADVRYEAELVGALAASGVPTPVPLEASDGRRYAPFRDSFASVFPWIAGTHRELGEVQPADVTALGAALGRLHQAGLPLADQFARAGIYTFDDIVGRLRGLHGTDDPQLVDAVELLDNEAQWLGTRAPDRDAAPRGVIHGDLFRDNVLFDGERAQLIDFEQASTGSLVYDIAVCINDWCFVDSFEPGLIAALVRGYVGERELGADEADLLYLEARASAMRFTVTRITDVYVLGTGHAGKDFRRYLRRLDQLRDIGAAEFRGWTGLV